MSDKCLHNHQVFINSVTANGHGRVTKQGSLSLDLTIACFHLTLTMLLDFHIKRFLWRQYFYQVECAFPVLGFFPLSAPRDVRTLRPNFEGGSWGVKVLCEKLALKKPLSPFSSILWWFKKTPLDRGPSAVLKRFESLLYFQILKNYMKLDYSLYGVDLFVKYFSASPLNFTVKRT